MGLGDEWADGHCVSHVAERTVHVGVPHPLTAYIHTVCSVLSPIQNHTASRPPNTCLFGKLGHVPTVLSKTMPAIPPRASGGLREMQGHEAAGRWKDVQARVLREADAKVGLSVQGFHEEACLCDVKYRGKQREASQQAAKQE